MAARTVLLFHGLGGDRHSMAPIAHYCAQHLADTSFVPLEGPLDLGNESAPALGWFVPPADEDRAVDGPHPPALEGLEQSVALVHGTVERLVDEGVPPATMHLLGHSQGGAIALAAALTCPFRLGSVNTVAGYLALTSRMQPTAKGTRYFLQHSEHDDNVSVKWAHYAADFLRKTGEPCSLQCWDIERDPHAVHDAQLDAVCTVIAGT